MTALNHRFALVRRSTSCAIAALLAASSGVLAQSPPLPSGYTALSGMNNSSGGVGCISVPMFNNGQWICHTQFQNIASTSIDQSGNIVVTADGGAGDPTSSISVSTYPGRAYGITVGTNSGNATANISLGLPSALATVTGADRRATMAEYLAYFASKTAPEDQGNLQKNFANIAAEAQRRGLVGPDGQVSIDDFMRVGHAYGIADDLRSMAVNGKVHISQFLDNLPNGTTQAARDRMIAQLAPDQNGMVSASRAATILGNFYYARREYDVASETANIRVFGNDSRGISVGSRTGTATATNHSNVFVQGDRSSGIRVGTGQPATGTTGPYIGLTASLTNYGDVTVRGLDTRGILVGSIGGNVVVNNYGNLTAEGISARGLSAGSDAPSGTLPSGTVTVFNAGAINVLGQFDVAGIRASTATGKLTINNSGDITVAGLGGLGIRALTTRGGEIEITNTGKIRGTTGETGGIRAEATGGGRVTIINSGDITSTPPGTGPDQDGGSSIVAKSAGGDASVTNSGYLRNSRQGATGIVTEVGQGTGPAGTATIDNAGRVVLTGESSLGLIGVNSAGGNVAIRNSGIVTATGYGSYGIAAFSYGTAGNGAGAVNITVDAGALVRGGSGPQGLSFGDEGHVGAAGILIGGGGTRSITNRGVISSANGMAIFAYNGAFTSGDESTSVNLTSATTTVTNEGTIIGSVVLGDATGNSINNTGRMVFGERIEVGAGNTVTNNGRAYVGGYGEVATTRMIGNFVLSSGGRLFVDIDGASSGQRNDRLEINGTATLNGTITANVMSSPTGVGDRFTIITTTGGITTTGLKVGATVGFRFAAELANNNKDLVLNTTRVGTLNTMAAAGNSAARQMAETLAAAEANAAISKTTASGNTFRQLTDAVRLQADETGATNAMSQLNPQSGAAVQQNTERSGRNFANAMLSCASGSADDGKFSREEQCLYATARYRDLDRSATASQTGGRETSQEFLAGTQVRLGGNWRLGVALGHEQISGSLNDGTQGLGNVKGERFVGGVVLKNQWGPWNAYFNVTGSQGSFDLKRNVDVLGTVAEADQSVSSFGLRARLSHTFDNGAWYAKPMLDAGATYTTLGGYTETSAGPANLVVDKASIWQYAFTPAIEVGSQFKVGTGVTLRPYAKVGVTYLAGSNLVITGNFADAPTGLAPFSLAATSDRTFFIADAGLQVMVGNAWGFKVNYEGQMSRHSEQHAISGKVSINY